MSESELPPEETHTEHRDADVVQFSRPNKKPNREITRLSDYIPKSSGGSLTFLTPTESPSSIDHTSQDGSSTRDAQIYKFGKPGIK